MLVSKRPVMTMADAVEHATAVLAKENNVDHPDDIEILREQVKIVLNSILIDRR